MNIKLFALLLVASIAWGGQAPVTWSSVCASGIYNLAQQTCLVTGGGGGVSSVTGSAPISSSGGANPNISITGSNLTDAGTDGITVTNGTGSVIGTGTAISQHVADATHSGYLATADWNTFNGKENAFVAGSISTSTTGVTVGSGANSTVGPNVTVDIQTATTAQPGLLSAADWNTFNGKQAAGNYITALTGDVVATGPGSVAASIQPNVVTNSQLSQAPTLTIKGNNTGSTANESDLTSAQVTAMLNPFVGDSGSGGTQGLVIAPGASTAQYGDYLSAGGSWSYVDQSQPIFPDFSYVDAGVLSLANVKANNIALYTGLDGNKKYAILVGAVAATISIWDVTDQNQPPVYLSKLTTLAGSYNVVVATIGGVIYALVPSSGGHNLYVVNVTNPSAPSVVTTYNVGVGAGSLYNIAYQGGYAYLATQSEGLVVVDIGGGGCAGTLLAPATCYTQAGGAKSFGVAVSGSVLYTTQYSTSPYATRLLNSWTLTGLGTPSVPSLSQSLTLPGLGETRDDH